MRLDGFKKGGTAFSGRTFTGGAVFLTRARRSKCYLSWRAIDLEQSTAAGPVQARETGRDRPLGSRTDFRGTAKPPMGYRRFPDYKQMVVYNSCPKVISHLTRGILSNMSKILASRNAGLGASAYDSARRPPPAVEELQALWRYRDLVVQLVRRDLVARYKRSVLGIAWTMLNPLGMMLVLTLVFSHLFRTVPAYPAYVLIGLMAWNFFAQSTVMAMRQLVWGGTLLQRIYMPRTTFAVSAVGTGLVNLVFAFIPLLVVLLSFR